MRDLVNYLLIGPYYSSEDCMSLFNEYDSDNNYFPVNYSEAKNDNITINNLIESRAENIINHVNGVIIHTDSINNPVSLFELGIYLSGNTCYESKMPSYLTINRKINVVGDDSKKEILSDIIYKSLEIDKISGDMDFDSYSNSFDVFDGHFIGINDNRSLNAVAIRVDNYKDHPENIVAAGYMYGRQVPFITYSIGKESNVFPVINVCLANVVVGSNKLEKIYSVINNYLNNINKKLLK